MRGRKANDRCVPSPSPNRTCRLPASGFRMAFLREAFTVGSVPDGDEDTHRG
jgi:hypothetical protein